MPTTQATMRQPGEHRPHPYRRRSLPRPPARAPGRTGGIPPEVAVAEAFIHMTGLDPTSIYGQQSPPPRQTAPSFGEAKAKATPPKPSLWARAKAMVKQVALGAASWLYHRALGLCLV